ncbi:MAG: VWA domain-containing protein [Microscillaceae bacterium]|nr:VWA domain-containing protein [Microscillaceae bacterium]
MSEIWNTFSWDWLALSWFYPSTFLEYSWANPSYLYLIAAIPLFFVFRALFNWKSRHKIEVSYPYIKSYDHLIVWLRFLPDTLMVFYLICIIIALARPQRADELVEQTSEGIDILLTLDISESMLLEDFLPNRLEASKKVAIDFLKGRKYDRIGLVIFSGDAYSLAPLTTDYQLLTESIAQIATPMIPEGGTAIGSALGVATNRFRESASKTKVIILISDGDNTAGSLDPLTAAQLAAYYGIKIYTIVVGRDGRVPMPGVFPQKRFMENTVNESTLREIAKIGEGEFFRASDNATLVEIFQRIDSFEKSEIKENRYQTTRDYYTVYLIWGILIFLCRLFLKSTFISNVLED